MDGSSRNGAEAGFSLMEALVATVITVVAVVGLAHTFGLGRGFIERFSLGRAALAAARGRMDALSVLPPETPSLAMDRAYQEPFVYNGSQAGIIQWRVGRYNDPLTASTADLKNVTVVVTWGAGTERDSLKLNRLFLN